MVSSFVFSILLLVLRKFGVFVPTHYALILTVAVTTISWVLTAYLGPQTDKAKLISFYRKVRPFGPGWKAIRKEAGISEAEAKGTGDSFPVALVGWVSGSLTIWSALFMVGNVLYGRWVCAGVLFAVFAASGLVLIKVVNRLWDKKPVAPGTPTSS
jgi:hypothetical protein